MTTLLGNRYILHQILGQGGMATVYAARDTLLDRDVALKMLRADLHDDEGARARFAREARIAAGLSHPHIARVYDVGEDPGYGPYFVQELVPGQLLAHVLPVAAPQALIWAEQIASALSLTHEQGFVHCDVKPHNVQITPDGRAVVFDFGIAELTGVQGDLIRGTPLYLAPERALGYPPTPAADVYSLGVMLYELLTGTVPVQPADGERSWQEVTSVPPLRETLPGAATAIESLLAQITAPNPAERPSMAEITARIQALQYDASRATTVIEVQGSRNTVLVNNMVTESVAPAPAPARAQPAVASPRSAKPAPWIMILNWFGALGHGVTRMFSRSGPGRPTGQRGLILIALGLLGLGLLGGAWALGRPEPAPAQQARKLDPAPAPAGDYKVYAGMTLAGPVTGTRALAELNGPVLLQDSFEERRWSVDKSNTWTLEYVDQRYRMAMNAGVNTLWSYSAQPLPAGNLALSVDIDPRQGSGGLLFGSRSRQEYYRLLSAADGSYRLEQRSNGTTNVLASGAGAGAGQLGLLLRGQIAQIYFNQALLQEIQLPTSAEGKYGMTLASAAASEALFDNLVVRQVP